MYRHLIQARKIQAQYQELERQMRQFAIPTQYDHAKLPAIYDMICRHTTIDQRDTRHCFVLIAVYLYSPSALLLDASIRAGLCRHIGEVIGRCRQEVSEIFSEAKFRYENVTSFRNQIETIFDQVENNWQ